MTVTRVVIGIMKESDKGLSYWVYLYREDGGKFSPYMSYYMDRAIYTAAEYANFLGLEVEKIEVSDWNPYLTQEMIDAGYEEAELMLSTLHNRDWTKY